MLQNQKEVTVRFNEADPLGIVWHGHYIRYFEDGREEFGKTYGISYLDFYRQGLAVPIVAVNCDFKRPLRYGHQLMVESTYVDQLAAKLKFNYRIFETGSGDLVATGSSMQVFVDVKTFDLHLTIPPFFEAWKKKMEGQLI